MSNLDINTSFIKENDIDIGPFSKTIKVSDKLTGEFYAQRFLKNIDEKSLKKFQKTYDDLYGMNYPCSILPCKVDIFSKNPCLYTPYFTNQSLKNTIQKLEEGNKIEELDFTQKLIIIYRILKFLESIHKNNRFHGRLTISNILLDSHFIPYVSDLFLYELNSNKPVNKFNSEMIDYLVSLPPEVFGKNPTYSCKSDIYSFGIIILQILTQKINVYSNIAKKAEEIISLKNKGEKPSLDKCIHPKHEDKLYEIINNCLEPKQDDRPTANQILHMFDCIIKDKQNYDINRFQHFMEPYENQNKNKMPKITHKNDQTIKRQSSKANKHNDHIYLKDDQFFKRNKPDLKRIIEKVKQIKKSIVEQVFGQNKLEKKGFIFTDDAIKRLTKLYYYLEDNVPVLLEGPTGTSKTLSSEIVCQLSKRKIIKFNLSSDTKSNYLLGRYIGDSKSWAGISMSIGPFIDAFRNGYTLLLDEINLASQECLQFIGEALDMHAISLELPGIPLEVIPMHEDFRLIATQNPNKGSFANKRYDFDNNFLSRFQVIVFPSFEEEEYKKIAKGLCDSFKYEASDDFIEDLIKFHMTWSSRDDVKNDVQCFTVREIAATINALANKEYQTETEKKKNIYETIMSIYGARYCKEQKEILKSELRKFNSFKDLEPKNFVYPSNFPHCYKNKNLEEALKSVFFSFDNNRNVILAGKEGSGISQVAKWVSQCYDKNKSKNMTKYFCVCTEETKCSDLIGYQKPSDDIRSGQELIVWKPGFLTEAIKNGKCAVLDSLDQAPSTVAERLNVLLDEKYDGEKKMFEIPENPQGEPIEINPKFRLLCTCRINNINQMSPAFLNRFDVVVLENQLEDISEENLKDLIKLLLLKSKIENKYKSNNSNNKDKNFTNHLNDDDDDDGDFSLEKENEEEEETNDEKTHSQIYENQNNNNETSFKHNNVHKSRNNDENDNFDDNDGDFTLENQNDIDDSDGDFTLESQNDIDDSDEDFSLQSEVKTVKHHENNDFEEENTPKKLNETDHALENHIDTDDSDEDFSLESEEKTVECHKDDDFEEEPTPEQFNEEKELVDLIFNVFDQTFTIYKLSLLCKSVIKYNSFFKNDNLSESSISKKQIVDFAKDLIINNETSDKIQEIPKEIEDYLIKTLNCSQGKNDSYFFEESPSLRTFIAKLFACSLINLHVCVYGPTGVGKTSSAKAFANRRQSGNRPTIGYRMHSFHVGTRPNNFYGSTTIEKGKVCFVYGTLTTSLINGYTFIADEMNLSSTTTMKSIAPALEPCIGESIYIPGVSEPVIIHPDFFFIACQNEVGTIGRNVLSPSISSRLKIIYYPKQSEDDISTICCKIAKSFYTEIEKPSFTDDDAKKIGTYMTKLNNEQKVIPQWSLRDISKIFKRVHYQDKNPKKYHQITLLHNILFYSLAPLNKKDTDEILNTVLKLIEETYNCEDKINDLKACFNSNPSLGNISTKKGTFLKKGDIAISTSSLGLFETFKNELSKLPTLLNSVFQVLLSDPTEPILLTGPSGFKTFLSQLFLDNPKIIALNQETSVSQLIGNSAFLSNTEAKFFYLEHLLKICKYYNGDIYELKNKLEKIGKLDKSDITPITEDYKNESFKYAIENLTNKLINNDDDDKNKNALSDMIIEFRPGEILSAIFEGKSIIFKDISNLPTVVLERFNELLSGDHNLTINEDYHNTFTDRNEKELKNFSSSFRAFATCQENTATKLSEAALSRFTVVTVPSYSIDELKDVLTSYNKINKKKLPDELTETIINFSKSAKKYLKKALTFTQMINILEICFSIQSSSINQRDLLGIILYRIFGGLIEKRKSCKKAIETIFDENKLKIPQISTYDIENNSVEESQDNCKSRSSNPFKVTRRDGLDGLESEITGLFIPSVNVREVQSNVEYTTPFIDIMDVIHLGISANIPVILEGNPGQGKETAIQLISQMLGYNVINIVISKSTKVNDLLGRVSIETDDNNSIHVKQIYTKLTKAIECKTNIDKTIFVFHNLNNASPAVLEKLSSLFDRNQDKFSLPDGTSIPKGRINIIGIFNPQNGISNREKLPSSIIYSSIYYIVDEPSNADIKRIIHTLLESKDLINDTEEYYKKYNIIRKFIIENNAYPPITVHDINKFILFRSVTNGIFSRELIFQMLFGYRFLQQETIDNALKKLNLFDISFQPLFIFDKSKKEVIIKESENSNGLHLKMNNESNVDVEQINAQLKSLTLAQQQCLLFLACSYLSKRACIIQGTTASGKSHIIHLFAKMLGQKLNVYQMNKDTDISFLTGQSVLSNKITEADAEKFKEAFNYLHGFNDLKKYIDENILNKKYDEWQKENFAKLLKKINNYETLYLSKDKENKLKKAETIIRQTMSPAKRFHKKESNFIHALENGELVLIDGIQNAPPEIAEKLSPLCGDNPELELFECGEGYFFSRNNAPNSRKIHDNFRLFVTYNPSSKTGTKILDQIFLNKCVSFTVPAIDSSLNSTARLLISLLIQMEYDKDFAIDIGQRLANVHHLAKEDSKKDRDSYAGDLQFDGRTLIFLLKEFERNSKNNENSLNDIEKVIYRALHLFYWNSYANKTNKKQFKSQMINKLSEDPDNYNFIVDIKDIDPKKKYEVLLNYLRNIQLYACNIIKEDNFNFNDFVEKCGKVQLLDISFIIMHLIDTLKIIEEQFSLNEKRKIPLLENQYSLIQIMKNLFDEIKIGKKSINSEYWNLPIINDDNILLSFDKCQKPISKMILLCEISKTNNFCKYLPYMLYDTDFIDILELVVKMAQTPNIQIFNKFISKLHKNENLISKIDDFFPYHLFENHKFNMILHWMPIIRKLHDKKITFHIMTNECNYDFIFPEYKNIEVTYAFKNNNALYLSYESMLSIPGYMKDKITLPKKLSEDELRNWSIKFVNYTNFLLINKKLTIIDLKNKSKDYKLELPKVTIQYPYLSKLYNEEISDSLVSRELSIIYNFDNKTIEILKKILHPIEGDVLNLIFHISNNPINVQEKVDIISRFSQIGDSRSKLWIILNNQYPSINQITDIEKERDEIENELQYLRELQQFDDKIWPYKTYIDHLQSKIDELNKEIWAKLQGNEKKLVREQLRVLRNELENEKISNENKFLKEELIQIITDTSQNSPTNENYTRCFEKVQQFISCLKKSETRLSSFIWPNYQSKVVKEIPEIKIYKNVIWFSRVKNLIDKICASNKSTFDVIFELNKVNEMKTVVHILMKQLMKSNEKHPFEVNIDDKKIIYSILNAHFISKLIKDKVSYCISNLDKIFNDLSLRNKILDGNEIEWIYQNVDKYHPFFNLVLPEFTQKDLLYLFIESNENEIIRGPLVSNFKCQKIVNKLFEDSNNIDYENDSFGICAEKIIISILKTILNEESFQGTHDDLKNFLKNEIQNNQKNNFLTLINEVLNISGNLDELKQPYKFNHDDIHFLQPKWLENMDYVSKYPSLTYWLVKNQKTATALQRMYSSSAINEKFLPFWLFALRIMSSQNCIEFDVDSKTAMSKIISQTISTCIKNLISSNNNKIHGTKWLSLVLSSVPSEIIVPNYRMFYDFLIHLSKDEKYISNALINEQKKEAIIDFTKKACDIVFKDELKSFFDKAFGNFNNVILKFINNPNNYISQQIKEYLDQSKNDYDSKVKKEFEKNSENEKAIKLIIENLKISIEKENEDRKSRFFNSLKKDKIEKMKKNIDDYNKLLEKIKSSNIRELVKFSSSINQLINCRNSFEIKIDYNKKDPLIVYKADWDKSFDIKLEVPQSMWGIIKETFFGGKSENVLLKASSNKSYYISKLMVDNVKISIIYDKNKKKKSKNKGKGKKDEINWIEESFYYIEIDENYLEQICAEIINSKYNENIPCIKFGKNNGVNPEEFISKLDSVSNIFSNEKNKFNESSLKEIISKYDEITKLFIVKFGNDICQVFQSEFKELNKLFDQLRNDTKKLITFISNEEKKDWMKISKTKIAHELFDNNFQLSYPSQKTINSSFEYNLNFNSLANANFLSIPILFVDNNKIACCYTQLDCCIGPLIPSLYSGEWVVNFISFIDFPISMKIEIDNLSDYKDMVVFSSIEKAFQPGEPVQIFISLIPNQIQEKKEFSISTNLKFESQNLTSSDLKCNFNFKLAPFTVLISCANYKFSLYDDMILLCTSQILPDSTLSFPLQLFYTDEKMKIVHQLIDFDDNEAEKPDIKLNKDQNELLLHVKNTKNIEKLHCMLKIKFLESLIANIIIDTVIIPFEYRFEIYDYSKKKYVSSLSNIYFSKKRKIKLHFRVYSTSVSSDITVQINSDFKCPISCSGCIKFQDETEFDLDIDDPNFLNSNTIYASIGKMKKSINLKFEELKITYYNYFNYYYNQSYFRKVPVYGYDWKKKDWIRIENNTNDIVFIVSPFHTINKIKSKEKTSVPQMSFEGWKNQTLEISTNEKNNTFISINEKNEIVTESACKYSFSNGIGIIGIIYDNWYPMFNDYPDYYENFSKLEMLEETIGIAEYNLYSKKPSESYLYKKISFNKLANLISENNEVIKNLCSRIIDMSSLFIDNQYYDAILELCQKIQTTTENDNLIPIMKNNLIFLLYKIFKSRYKEIVDNQNYIPKLINDSEIREKEEQVYNDYFRIQNHDKDEEITKYNNKIKKLKDNITSQSQQLDQYESFLFSEYTQEPKPFLKENIPPLMESEIANNTSILEKSININLPIIDIPEESEFKKLSINSLNHFYENCTEATRLFPIYVKNKISQNPREIKEYFFKLLQIYQPLPSNDFSFISKSVNTFSRSFESMIKKFENAGVNFGNLVQKKIINTENNNQEFIQYPEKNQISNLLDDWKMKNKLQNNTSHQVIVNSNFVSRSSTYKVDIDNISIPKSMEKNEEQQSSLINEPISDPNANVINPELVYTTQLYNQMHKNDYDDDENENENNTKSIKVSNPNGPKENITVNKLDGLLESFKEEDGIERAISLMKRIDSEGSCELHPYEVHPFDEELYLTPDNKVTLNDYSILPLINQSFVISQEFIKVVSSLEIPFSTICVNILVDCSKFISKENKLYNMMIICALTDALTTFGIPYSVSVIGDSNFKCIIKPFSENHSYICLQRICECIMIDRFYAELPDCIHYAINEMKYTDDSRMNRAIFTFTNGLDDNVVQKNQWTNLFSDSNLSFGFIFIKSDKLTKENLTFLEEKWDNFEKIANENNSVVKIAKISADIIFYNSDGEISDIIKSLVNLFVTVLQGNAKKIEDKIETDHKYETPIFELSNDIKLTDLLTFTKYMENKYDHLTNVFIRKTDVLKNVKTTIDPLIVKNYSNNINKVLSCKVDDSLRLDFLMFVKLLIQSQRNINLSSKEIIFKPNKASRLEPSSSGTVFDVSALILYLINPVPEPMIYLEEKGGLILNYGVSVVIDLSYSCFNSLSASHSFQTIMAILSSLSSVDLPCFDLIVATNSSPIVLCSGVKTLYALNERSHIWNSLFAIIQNYTSNFNRADLASAIHTAFDLRRMRSIQCTNILFVLTDGLYQISERSRIIDSVNNCVQSGMNTFGIGMGIYPKGIEKLFPQVIFAENPSNALKGISDLCENEYYDLSKSMSCINSYPDQIQNSMKIILDKQNDLLFQSLVNELSKIPPTLRAFRDFMNMEDPDVDLTPDLANPEGKNKELYTENLLKTQKILIVQLCDDSVCGDDQLNKEYIFKNYIPERTECINEAVKFFGISIEVVQNYEDAIHELTKSKTEFCDYYACWIICSSHPEKLPANQKATNLFLVEQFIDVLILFWKNGGSLVFWADNDPYTFQVNVFLNKVTFEEEKNCPSGKVTFQIHGDDHPGKEMLDGDRTGKLDREKLFNKERQIFKELERSSLSNNLYHIYEGSTLSYVENVGLNEKEKILPFIPFAIDSNGGITSLFYPSNLNTKTGDIIIDCGFSKLFYELTTEGTYRYIRNIAGWTARPEVHIYVDKVINPCEWRPKAVHYDIKYVEVPDYSDYIIQLISRASTFRKTSVIKDNVRRLGGDVFCDLRFSIQWNDLGFWDENDLDAHCIEPRGFEIMFSSMTSPDTEGTLDVDITDPEENIPACENIRWKSVKTMNDGTYRFFVHQYDFCNGTSGFRAEIEFNNRIYYYDYRNTLQQDEDVDVALVTLSNGKFSIQHKLKCC